MVTLLSNILRNNQTVFHSGCTILHAHQHPRQHSLFVFLIMAILVDMKWYLTVIVILFPQWWISMLAICVPSSLPIKKFGLSLNYWMTWGIWFINIFFHSVNYLFISLMVSFAAQNSFLFCSSPIYLFGFWVTSAFGVVAKKPLPNPQRFTPVFSPNCLIVLALTFKSLICVESAFLCMV